MSSVVTVSHTDNASTLHSETDISHDPYNKPNRCQDLKNRSIGLSVNMQVCSWVGLVSYWSWSNIKLTKWYCAVSKCDWTFRRKNMLCDCIVTVISWHQKLRGMTFDRLHSSHRFVTRGFLDVRTHSGCLIESSLKRRRCINKLPFSVTPWLTCSLVTTNIKTFVDRAL